MRRSPLAIVFVLLTTGLVLATPPDRRELMGRLEQALNSHDIPGMISAIEGLASLGTEEAVRTVIQVGLATEQLEQLSPNESNRVFEATKRALAGVRNEGAVSLIREEAGSSRNWRVQALMVQVLRMRGEEADLDRIIELLGERRVSEHAKRAACRALGDARIARAVDPLIDLVDATERSQGMVWVEANEALTEITGQEFPTANDWRNWWAPNRASFDPDDVQRDATRGGGTRSRNAPDIFGEEILSKRIVFVLDVSGSMTEVDPPPPEGERPTGGDDGDGSTTGRPGRQQGGNNGGGGGADPDDESRRRITRAKNELIRVVEALDPDVHFTIIAYSNRIAFMDGSGGRLSEGQEIPAPDSMELTRASRSGKRQAIDFIRGFQAEGLTWTDYALRAAFRFEQANTIYLVSDGAPTHDGQTPLPTGPILEEIQELNRLRDVTINALCFPGANHSFMASLANQNGGNHRDIP